MADLKVSEPEVISDSAAPPLLAGEFEAKILQRQGAMQHAPCYRCDHTLAAPDPGCPCCLDAHTPSADGHFTTCTADEFAKMRL